MRAKRNNPFKISYLAVAVICSFALTSIYSYILYINNNKNWKENNQKKAELVLTDFENQIQQFWDAALQIAINKRYQPLYFEGDVSEKLRMLEDFQHYQNYSPLTEEVFLYYGEDRLFCSSGYIKSLQTYLSRFSQEDMEIFREELFRTRELLNKVLGETSVLATSEDICFFVPFQVSAGEGKRNAVLFFEVGKSNQIERFEVVSGGIRGNISLYREDILLCSSQEDPCTPEQKGVLTVSTLDGLYTICYLPEDNPMLGSMILLQVLVVLIDILLIYIIATVYAEKSYKPIREIVEKYNKKSAMLEVTQGENALVEINHMIENLLEHNEEVSAQVKHSQEIMRRNVLQMLLEGTFSSDTLSYLSKLPLKLPGPYFYVLSISFQQEEDVSNDFLLGLSEDLEQISSEEDEEYVYAVCDYGKKRISVICSIIYEDRKEELSEYICEVAQGHAYKPVIGIGNIYHTLSRVSASWLESVDNICSKERQQSYREESGFIYDSEVLQRISAALVSGNETEALEGLKNYVIQMRSGSMSLLMQQYIIMDFVSEMIRQARKQQIELSNQIISLIISAKNAENFEMAAQELIHDFYQKLISLRKQVEEEDLYKIYEYVKEHFSEYDLSIEKVAIDLNVSTMMIRQAIMKQTGMMYKDYIIFLRIEYAKKLLLNEEMTVAAVCEKAGYGNVSYFIKLFKEMTGVTPAKYRQGRI